MSKIDYFEKATMRATEAVKSISKIDKRMESSYNLYLEQLIEDTDPNATKGLDLHIFSYVQALVELIEELNEKLEKQEQELQTINTLFNKLLNK